MNALSAHWSKWLDENILRGTAPQVLISALIVNKFDPDFATSSVMSRVVKMQMAAASTQAGNVLEKPERNGDGYIYEDTGPKLGNRVRLADREVGVLVNLKRPRIAVFENLLSTAECKALIELARPKLTPSMMVDKASGELRPDPTRISDGTFFKRDEDALISVIDQRIAELMQLPLSHGEELQILNYRVGGEYKPHYDYFPPHLPGSAPHIAIGQRIATMILYLNDVEAGGETNFPKIGLSIMPRAGNALYFSYLNSRGQVDPLTLHAGCPVITGEKWIATRWMREREYACQ
jgi:prolyl 4-hydroxylase